MAPSPSERRALLLLLALAVAGHIVRRFATRPGQPPGDVTLLAEAPPAGRSALAAHRDSALQASRPLAPGERIDLDRAPASEIARLPRVGLPLAKTIVADRETNGAFGSLAGLDRVPGIGPGLLKLVEPHVAFSGTSRASQDRGISPEVANATPIEGPSGAKIRAPVDVNVASLSDLEALPGIGPTRAQAIVRYRERHGPFLSVEALVQVPGIGPAALARLRSLVTVH